MQAYSDPRRESDPYALPDVEVFYVSAARLAYKEWLHEDGELLTPGFYYWYCSPGYMPDSEPSGPYDSEAAALAAMREDADTVGLPDAMSRIAEAVGPAHYAPEAACFWCAVCAPEDAEQQPAYEADTPDACDHCGGMLDCDLTDEGRRYVAEALAEGTGDAGVLDLWRKTWPELAPNCEHVDDYGDKCGAHMQWDANVAQWFCDSCTDSEPEASEPSEA